MNNYIHCTIARPFLPDLERAFLDTFRLMGVEWRRKGEITDYVWNPNVRNNILDISVNNSTWSSFFWLKKQALLKIR